MGGTLTRGRKNTRAYSQSKGNRRGDSIAATPNSLVHTLFLSSCNNHKGDSVDPRNFHPSDICSLFFLLSNSVSKRDQSGVVECARVNKKCRMKANRGAQSVC